MHVADPAKAELRVAARESRREAQRLAGPGAAMLIADNFLQHVPWPSAKIIAGYLPIGEEADIMPLLEQLAGHGVRLALPAVTARGEALEFRRWQPNDALEQGLFGTRQPLATAQQVVPDLLLVPLLAFDARGTRLGYGGGYYDRTLAALRRGGQVAAAGIAYQAQEMPSLPEDAHDQRLDWIVTERDAREFKA